MEETTRRHVICAGMYRACSTWQYEVVGHLMEDRQSGRVARLGYLEGPAYRNWLRRQPREDEPPAVFKCHDKHREFDRSIRRGELRVVYAYRDLRDVVDSMRHKMGASLDALIRQGLITRTLANDRFWSTRPGVIVQRYEDIIAEPSLAVAELAGWLGVDLRPGEAHSIAAVYSLEANRKRTEALRRDYQADGDDRSKPSDQQRYDPATLLHWNHLRQGRSGGWREALGASDLVRIDRQAGAWLIERGYERDGGWVGSGDDRPGRLQLRLESARARWAATVYFTARRHPRLADALRRASGMGPLATAGATSVVNSPHEVTSNSPAA